MSKRIGLFSGTFDPVHIGHLEVCLVALGACQLDEVLVMIEKKPRRKLGVSSFKDRVAMLELALADFEHIRLFEHAADNIEFQNTLPELKEKYDTDNFCLIIGSDMLEHLHDWPQANKWLPQLELCVVLRDNKEKAKTKKLLEKLSAKHIKVLPAVWSPVSSSVVKNEIAKTGYSEGVHRDVVNYIKKHHLYQG